MLRGYRLIIVAACVVTLLAALGTGAFFGALYAPHYGYNAESSTYRRANTENGNPNQIDRDRAGLPYFAESLASGPDPQDRYERERRDLAAQESMSIWAFWLLAVSVFGTLVTTIGTSFLLWQIMLTRQAVRDSGNATEAMLLQNEISERGAAVAAEELAVAQRSFEVQSRPYVAYSGLKIQPVRDFISQEGGEAIPRERGLSIAFQWKNYGNGIATRVHMGTVWYPHTPGTALPTDVPPFTEPQDTPMLMAPGSQNTAFQIMFSGDNLERFLNNQMNIIFHGIAVYVWMDPDIRYVSEVCFLLSVNGMHVSSNGEREPITHAATIIPRRNRMT